MIKLALVGPNGVGKSSNCFFMHNFLTNRGYTVKTLVNTDRIEAFPNSKLADTDLAHGHIIHNIMRLETEVAVLDNCDILLVDRSVVDLYATAKFDWPDSEYLKSMETLIDFWSKSYDRLFYLSEVLIDPSTDTDTDRPDLELRLSHAQNMDKVLKSSYPETLVPCSSDDLFDCILTYLETTDAKR